MKIEEAKKSDQSEIKHPEPKMSQEKLKISQEKPKIQRLDSFSDSKTSSLKTPSYERVSSKSEGDYDLKEGKMRFDEEEENRWSHDEILGYRIRTSTADFVCKEIGNSKSEFEKPILYSQQEKEKVLQGIESKFSPLNSNIKKISTSIDLLFGDDNENSKKLENSRGKRSKNK